MNKAELRAHLDGIDPGFTAMIDGLRSDFPGLKLVYLETSEVKIGTLTDQSKLVEMTDSTPVAVIQEAWKRSAEIAADMHKRQRGFKVKPRASTRRK